PPYPLAHHRAAPRHLLSFPTRRSSDLPHGGLACLPHRITPAERVSGVVNLVEDHKRPPLFDADAEAVGVGGQAGVGGDEAVEVRSEEHTSELQSRFDLVCRLLLEKQKN